MNHIARSNSASWKATFLVAAILAVSSLPLAANSLSAPHPCKDLIQQKALNLVPVSLEYTEGGQMKVWQIQISGNPVVQPKYPGVTDPGKHVIKLSMGAIYQQTLNDKNVPLGTKLKMKQKKASGGHTQVECGRAIGVLVHELLHLCLGAAHDGSLLYTCAHLAIDIKSAELLCGEAQNLKCDEISDLQSQIDSETDPGTLEALEEAKKSLEELLKGVCLEIEIVNDRWEHDMSDPSYQPILDKVKECAGHGASAPFDPPVVSACLPANFPEIDPGTGDLKGPLSEVIPECDACDESFNCP